jgi:hypothetical protein
VYARIIHIFNVNMMFCVSFRHSCMLCFCGHASSNKKIVYFNLLAVLPYICPPEFIKYMPTCISTCGFPRYQWSQVISTYLSVQITLCSAWQGASPPRFRVVETELQPLDTPYQQIPSTCSPFEQSQFASFQTRRRSILLHLIPSHALQSSCAWAQRWFSQTQPWWSEELTEW